MQPVKWLSDVSESFGAWGYSALVLPLLGSGEPQRKTLYFLRDGEGWCKHVLILDAKEAL